MNNDDFEIREIWKPVKGHDKYEVSNLGRIRNVKTEKILKNTKNKPGNYYRVHLDGKHQYVHRVVAQAFFDVPDDGDYDVNHLDGDPSNNTLPNLDCCSHRSNIDHAWKYGLAYPSTVKVVRCKFCKNRYKFGICDGKDDGFYCSYGER